MAFVQVSPEEASSLMQRSNTFGKKEDTTKGSIAVSVQGSPPLSYQNIRQPSQGSNGLAPFQIPFTFPQRPAEQVTQPAQAVLNTPKLPPGKSRPLPVPNHPPTTSMYTTAVLHRKPSLERTVPPSSTFANHPPISIQNGIRRPLPQRPNLASHANTPPSQTQTFPALSSTSTLPSLVHSHSRSISSSTTSDLVGLGLPGSTSSYATTFSISSHQPKPSTSSTRPMVHGDNGREIGRAPSHLDIGRHPSRERVLSTSSTNQMKLPSVQAKMQASVSLTAPQSRSTPPPHHQASHTAGFGRLGGVDSIGFTWVGASGNHIKRVGNANENETKVQDTPRTASKEHDFNRPPPRSLHSLHPFSKHQPSISKSSVASISKHMISNPQPLRSSLEKTRDSTPKLPPLDLGISISMSDSEFKFLAPSPIPPKSDAQAIVREAPTSKVDAPLSKAKNLPTTVAPTPYNLPPIPASLPPQPPVSQALESTKAPSLPVTSAPSQPPSIAPPPLFLEVPNQSNPPTASTLPPPYPAGSTSSSRDPSPSSRSDSDTPSGAPKKQRPILALRTWDLDPPKRSRPRKPQVVQIQTLDGQVMEEDGQQPAKAVRELPKRPEPAIIAPAPSRVPASVPKVDVQMPSQLQANYIIPGQRPSFLPHDSDDHSSVGHGSSRGREGISSVPMSSAGPDSAKSGRKWSISSAVEALKNLRKEHRKSRSLGSWNDGGVFFKATSATTTTRPTFPHYQLASSSLQNIDSSLAYAKMQPQPTSDSRNAWYIDPPTQRSASAPRPLEPSLRNEPTFLGPNSHVAHGIARPFTTTPVGRPINALWTKLRANKPKLGKDERIDLL